jgi:signal transduction histidine kinase
MYSANSSDNEPLYNNEQLVVKESNGQQEQQQELTIQKLKSENEQLRVHSKMQKDFINLAIHEIRSPIQPILGLTQVVRSRIKENTKECELLDVVIRNVKRLQQLTDDLLDVSKIESQSLLLKKERFNLIDFLSSCIQDYKIQLENNKSNVKLLLLNNDDDKKIMKNLFWKQTGVSFLRFSITYSIMPLNLQMSEK